MKQVRCESSLTYEETEAQKWQDCCDLWQVDTVHEETISEVIGGPSVKTGGPSNLGPRAFPPPRRHWASSRLESGLWFRHSRPTLTDKVGHGVQWVGVISPVLSTAYHPPAFGRDTSSGATIFTTQPAHQGWCSHRHTHTHTHPYPTLLLLN